MGIVWPRFRPLAKPRTPACRSGGNKAGEPPVDKEPFLCPMNFSLCFPGSNAKPGSRKYLPGHQLKMELSPKRLHLWIEILSHQYCKVNQDRPVLRSHMFCKRLSRGHGRREWTPSGRSSPTAATSIDYSSITFQWMSSRNRRGVCSDEEKLGSSIVCFGPESDSLQERKKPQPFWLAAFLELPRQDLNLDKLNLPLLEGPIDSLQIQQSVHPTRRLNSG
jgi:hypothetical protein